MSHVTDALAAFFADHTMKFDPATLEFHGCHCEWRGEENEWPAHLATALRDNDRGITVAARRSRPGSGPEKQYSHQLSLEEFAEHAGKWIGQRGSEVVVSADTLKEAIQQAGGDTADLVMWHVPLPGWEDWHL